MVTRRRFECFSWFLGPGGSQRCCWTVRASMTKRAKTYAVVIPPPERWGIQCVSCFLCEDFSAYKLKVSEFQPWSGHCPLTQHHVLGQHRICWEVVGGLEGSTITSPWTSSALAVPSLPGVLLHWLHGTKEPLRSCRCSAGNAELPQLQQETRREKLKSLRLLSEMKHVGISQCQSLLGRIPLWQKRRGKACLNSHINHSLPHSWEHVRITLTKFSNLKEFKINLVQDPLPPPELYAPLLLLCVWLPFML